MRIGIDARMLGQGFGIARYIQQLVLQLEQLDTENEYVLFMRKENWDEYEPQSPRCTKVLADIAWYSVAEQRKMPALIRAAQVDLMHFPHWNVPLLYRGPFVLTMHDLTMYHFPRPEATLLGPLKFWIKDFVHRLVIQRATKQAAHIFVTSEFTKQDVHDTLGVPKKKMTVTYQAPFNAKRKGLGETESVLKKYNIQKPFVLYVGAAYPHKNVSGLCAAWTVFEEDYDADAHQLVLVGKRNAFYDRLLEAGDGLYCCNRLNYVGFVPDHELAAIYAEAALFVFPSLYEGFGIPPLEAMAAGVPVVSSNRSCLPEVLADAALYVDPENTGQFAETIHQALTDKDMRAQLLQHAGKNLERFSWKHLAQQTHDIYKKVLK